MASQPGELWCLQDTPKKKHQPFVVSLNKTPVDSMVLRCAKMITKIIHPASSVEVRFWFFEHHFWLSVFIPIIWFWLRFSVRDSPSKGMRSKAQDASGKWDICVFFEQIVQQKWMWKNVWSWWWLESCGTLHPKMYSKGILSINYCWWQSKPLWSTLNPPTHPPKLLDVPQKNGRTKALKDLQKKVSWWMLQVDALRDLLFVQFVLQVGNQTSQAETWTSWRCISYSADFQLFMPWNKVSLTVVYSIPNIVSMYPTQNFDINTQHSHKIKGDLLSKPSLLDTFGISIYVTVKQLWLTKIYVSGSPAPGYAPIHSTLSTRISDEPCLTAICTSKGILTSNCTQIANL